MTDKNNGKVSLILAFFHKCASEITKKPTCTGTSLIFYSGVVISSNKVLYKRFGFKEGIEKGFNVGILYYLYVNWLQKIFKNMLQV
jgi:hypothetical protein